MSHEQTIKRLFEFFYNKLHKTNLTLDLDKNNHRKQIANFLDTLVQYFTMESVGTEFMLAYFSSQFAYWSSKVTKRKVSLSWVTGTKAFKRWFERKDGTDYYTERFLHEHSINLDELRTMLAKPVESDDYLKLSKSEELEKSRRPDTDARVFHCLNTTTLFNHRSPVCITCQQRKLCRRLLSKVNFSLYTKRGYDLGAES